MLADDRNIRLVYVILHGKRGVSVLYRRLPYKTGYCTVTQGCRQNTLFAVPSTEVDGATDMNEFL